MAVNLLKHATKLSAVAGLALLTACATPFQARVQSFQALPAVQGQTFDIVPADSANSGSLEFASYAELVSAELRKAGFQPVAASADPQLRVLVDYGSGPGREKIATRPNSYSPWGWGGWGGWGWGRSGYYYPGWYGPWYGGWGGWDTPDVYSYTVYPAYLHVVIERTADKQSLFEGRAESTTRRDDLPSVMPKLVQALFTDFPGAASRSTVVSVPDKKN